MYKYITKKNIMDIVENHCFEGGEVNLKCEPVGDSHYTNMEPDMFQGGKMVPVERTKKELNRYKITIEFDTRTNIDPLLSNQGEK